MTMAEMTEIIEKLVYQVKQLGTTIDYEKHPVEALILSNNWGPADLDKAHDIFERWDERLEKGEAMNTSEFEGEFNRELNISYQGLKSVILAFYKNHQWTNVCEAYVDAFGATPSSEYRSIARRVR